MATLISRPAGALSGRVATPGDKSISHRALILAANATGESTIRGLLEADDVLATADALRALGADITADGGVWTIRGRGIGGLVEPGRVLDMGNSGTGVRLLMGLVASHPFTTFFTGDESLRARPMRRVIDPLTEIGAAVWSRSQARLPLAVRGAIDPLPIDYTQTIASAQVKSAILLAALNTPGRTRIVEPAPSRDHSERMLAHFGAELRVDDLSGGRRAITLVGQPELTGRALSVPGDISSAAFPLVAALVIPGSELVLSGVGINPLRTGLLETLMDMGARIGVSRRRERCGELIAELGVAAGELVGVDVPAERVPRMIDEFPILAVAAACARGRTRMSGLGELRVKESDRLAAIADGLRACGIAVETGAESMVIEGARGRPPGGGCIRTRFDHRIAMAFLVLGAAAAEPVSIDDGAAIATSFPGFAALMNAIGADITELQA